MVSTGYRTICPTHSPTAPDKTEISHGGREGFALHARYSLHDGAVLPRSRDSIIPTLNDEFGNTCSEENVTWKGGARVQAVGTHPTRGCKCGGLASGEMPCRTSRGLHVRHATTEKQLTAKQVAAALLRLWSGVFVNNCPRR